MLTNSKQLLVDARKDGYAIGAFNTSDLEITQAILEAANEEKSPVVIQTSPTAIEYAGLENLVSIIKNEAQKYKIPIALHLDHGKSIELVKKCLEIGYTSVMIDGSRLEFEENVKLTKKVVNLAKKYDVQIEAELGAIPSSGHSELVEESQKTNPDQARKFVELTGIDTLAVSIGNIHGVPVKGEKLDFKLLEKIAQEVSIPLALHGASSTPKNDIKKAIHLGIAKINIDTDIRLAFSGSIKKFQATHPNVYDPREILNSAKEAVRKVVEEKIKLFKNS